MLPALVSLLVLLPFQGATTAAPSLRQALQADLDAYVAAGRVPGVSAGIVTADGVEFALAAGLADREQKTPLRPEDRMCGGSNGKTFVAAVALELVQEGKLRLDALVGEYLGNEPWFEHVPNSADVTIEHLLSHRTGIPRHEFDPKFQAALLAEPDRVWKPAELVAYVLDHKPPFAAGEGFQYSDTNFVLLGMVIESLTGKTLYEEVERRLLGPLKLDGVRAQDGRKLPGLVQGYAGPRNSFGPFDRCLLSDGRFVLNPQFEWAGGGFIANGGTLARWAKALYEGPVLTPETRARMFAGKEARELGRGMRYGLACEIWPSRQGACYGHGGFFPGYMTEMRYWLEHRVAVAVQVNTSEFEALPRPLGELCETMLATVLAGD